MDLGGLTAAGRCLWGAWPPGWPLGHLPAVAADGKLLLGCMAVADSPGQRGTAGGPQQAQPGPQPRACRSLMAFDPAGPGPTKLLDEKA